jgi:hypothetical protein
LRTDEKAERFAAGAELTERDFLAMVSVRFGRRGSGACTEERILHDDLLAIF